MHDCSLTLILPLPPSLSFVPEPKRRFLLFFSCPIVAVAGGAEGEEGKALNWTYPRSLPCLDPGLPEGGINAMAQTLVD